MYLVNWVTKIKLSKISITKQRNVFITMGKTFLISTMKNLITIKFLAVPPKEDLMLIKKFSKDLNLRIVTNTNNKQQTNFNSKLYKKK